MTKNKYMTKYQLEHLKSRVKNEIKPLIEEAELLRRSVVADMTASAEKKLSKKIITKLNLFLLLVFQDVDLP